MSESLEMYLKTIFLLMKEKKNIKAIDIAKHLNYSKASVSIALSNLKELGLVIMSNQANIKLTKEGYDIAIEIYNKYLIIKEYLKIALELDDNEANINACLMEHDITNNCYNKMTKYVKEKM